MTDSFPHRAVRKVSEGDTLRFELETDDGDTRTVERIVQRTDADSDLGEILKDPVIVYLGGESATLRLLTFRTLHPKNPVYVARDSSAGVVGSTWRDYGHVTRARVVRKGREAGERALADGGSP